MDMSGDHEPLTSSLTIVRWNFGTACTCVILIAEEVNAVKERVSEISRSNEPIETDHRDRYHCHRIRSIVPTIPSDSKLRS